MSAALPPKPPERSPTKKKKKTQQTTLVPAIKTSKQLNEALKGKYAGKRILLTATFLYGRRIPEGEENLLFQYHVTSINDDNKTAIIEYDEKCIVNGDHQFTSYPDTTGKEGTIENYELGTFKEDHELFLQHVGRGNKIAYLEKEARKQKERDAAAAAAKDLSDIQFKLENGDDPFEVLKSEFESCSILRDHIVGRGPNKGKVHKKQNWSELLQHFKRHYFHD